MNLPLVTAVVMSHVAGIAAMKRRQRDEEDENEANN